jgi:hypothetical protein
MKNSKIIRESLKIDINEGWNASALRAMPRLRLGHITGGYTLRTFGACPSGNLPLANFVYPPGVVRKKLKHVSIWEEIYE